MPLSSMGRKTGFQLVKEGSSPFKGTIFGLWMWLGVTTGLSIQGDGFESHIDRKL